MDNLKELAKRFMDCILYDNDFINREEPFNEEVHYGKWVDIISDSLNEPVKRIGYEFFTDDVIEILSVGDFDEMCEIVNRNNLYDLNNSLTSYYEYLEDL